MTDTRTTEDLADDVRDGIYGDDRMTRQDSDNALAALKTLVDRLTAYEAKGE